MPVTSCFSHLFIDQISMVERRKGRLLRTIDNTAIHPVAGLLVFGRLLLELNRPRLIVLF